MRRKDDYLNKIIRILKDLKKKYPSLEITRHLSTATSEYPDIWGISDKELYYCLARYQEETTFNPIQEEDLNLEDAFNVEDAFKLEDEEEDY